MYFSLSSSTCRWIQEYAHKFSFAGHFEVIYDLMDYSKEFGSYWFYSSFNKFHQVNRFKFVASDL